MFVLVVHTRDKEGKDIDKICARDFGKGRDSYRKLLIMIIPKNF